MPAEPNSAPPSRLRRALGRLAPYVIAAVAVVVILGKYPPARIAEEMTRGKLLPMVPYALLLLVTALATVAGSDTLVIHGCVQGPSYWRVLRARVGVALLGLVGYAAGIGGYGLWLARVTGAGAGLSGGMALYIVSSDLVAVSLVTSAAIWIGGAEAAPALGIAAPVIAAVLLALKLADHLPLVPTPKLPAVFLPWRKVKPGRLVAQLALRTANIYLNTLCAWGAANAFGMPVPLWAMATYFPLVLVVGSMPVNVAGIGAVQGAWLLLAPWASSGEQVLAFAVLWQLMVGAGVVLRGLPFVRQVVGEIERGLDREDRALDHEASSD
ncbi:MAG: hypothetical protein JRI68_00435 [Deltaproteobacteria bacterium]|nr:hypothetical protein [Deltaproteobacteria bacterium]